MTGIYIVQLFTREQGESHATCPLRYCLLFLRKLLPGLCCLIYDYGDKFVSVSSIFPILIKHILFLEICYEVVGCLICFLTGLLVLLHGEQFIVKGYSV